MSSNQLKMAAAKTAAEYVAEGMRVGLGSGSTLALVLDELGRRVREEHLAFVGVATSFQSHQLAVKHGIPLLDPMDMEELDLALDGADEIDPQGHHLKGGGAAMVMERIVAAAARRYIVVVDESKRVQRLGQAPVVCEVVAPALASALRRLRELGGSPAIRSSGGKLGPVMSDFGHPVIDVRFEAIDDPAGLDARLNAIPGMVGHGLFVGLATDAMVARRVGDSIKTELLTYRRT